MRRTVVRIGPHAAGRVAAAIYAVLGLLMVPFVALPALLAPNGNPAMAMLGLAFPVLYAIAGYLGVGLMCWVYNLVAARVGGLELEMSEGAVGD